jgi:hypothetical protein
MAQTLTRYDHENIRNLIDGYMVHRGPTESSEDFFQRAKDELTLNLELRLAQVRAYTFADFTKKLL